MLKRMPLIVALAIPCLWTAHQGLSGPAPAAKKEQSPEPTVKITAKDTRLRLEYIKTALGNYCELTNVIHDKSNLEQDYGINVWHGRGIKDDAPVVVRLTGKDLKKYCPGWESRHLGFPNCAKTVEGYIEIQELENCKLRLEIAQLKKAPAKELEELKKEIDRREKNLKTNFLDPQKWAD